VPLLVYSLLRLVLFVACWVALVWAGLNPLVAVVVAALAAWGLSYVAMRGPRDAAARWLAEQEAKRRGVPQLSARARKDAADEDALVESQAEASGAVGPDTPDETVPDDDPHDDVRHDDGKRGDSAGDATPGAHVPPHSADRRDG
jgi:hypothetical protein